MPPRTARAFHPISKLYQPASARYVRTSSSWQPVIGLEIHAQLLSPVKLFSKAPHRSSDEPNTNIELFDVAIPGTLPVLQAAPVLLALRAALALDCTINHISRFDRKHYFYPDLPSGWQITQKYQPLAHSGSIKLTPEQDEGVAVSRDVRIEQVQLEQDTAKTVHLPYSGLSQVDMSRAGSALIEIISGPDMRTAEEAMAYVRRLRSLLQHVGACDGNMDQGSLRIDANVSVRKAEPDASLGQRCEIKNLNSIRQLQQAITYEVERQSKLLDDGQAVESETRGFDAQAGETYAMRSKAATPDYRYMPDPDLPPLVLSQSFVQEVRQAMPELPLDAFARLILQYGLRERDARILVAYGESRDKEESAAIAVRFFEDAAQGRDPQMVVNWLINDLFAALADLELPLGQCVITPADLGTLVDAVQSGGLARAKARELLNDALQTHSIPLHELVSKHVQQDDVNTTERLAALAQDIVIALPDEADKVRRGNNKVMQRMIGEGMKRTAGRVDARKLTEALRQWLHATGGT
ncbi:uncharacterized protein L969DRAFT_385386 [Mixia osmundae IAM 14324]|uniref:Glutamyl-tRNA(Gln) amidotransferase subunit B, mitochondrial n=1 Tax=Mixia osmundae (strain CBS 9802 / IAM 14324 / JCM 22182 / KY 12970) TaxID=764103 RepID=G7E9G9_MIXOS|nr:uncharacterized protein L969DRAFT_385386 [Mixia osmundae IAM 14324]KEI39921.1 hypothetical protein L969DRAFT_385386 [Mixia osmundae IAM 14324]GAA99288.1 hypothetical protein E5Q_05983 [Mixia osmundae IAM 14324]